MNPKPNIYCHPENLPPFEAGSACFQHTCGHQNRLLIFQSPANLFTAAAHEDIPSLLDEVEQEVNAGRYAAGGIRYEAAPAFDPAFPVRPHDQQPLAWFSLYDHMQVCRIPTHLSSDYTISDWKPEVSKTDYLDHVHQIRHYIESGDCYQANYTFPMTAEFSGNAWPYFLRLIEAHRCRYGALLHMGDTLLCSASPELFFEQRRNQIRCKPMKGTCERGLTTAADREKAQWLAHSQKNRAENVMIVDMVRNDLGRIAKPGTVHVPHLFEVETYPTVHQMTSTVTAQSDCSTRELFQALFPCASITGAPKKRCMEIIQELEPHPRGFYTGCTGFMTPSGFSRFNVAIRTVSIHTSTGRAAFGTGSGVVWDSDPEQEYRESISKVRFLNSIVPHFQLLETIYGDENGYTLLDRHLQRMEASATHFSVPWNEKRIRKKLDEAISETDGPHKFRLLIDPRGHIDLEKHPLEKPTPWNVALAKKPVSSATPFLYHKTTYRKPYREHLDAQPGFDDILLYNERGELTEFCFGNLVLTMNGKKYTPPVRCGLLNGTFRQHLLNLGAIEEKTLTKEDLPAADTIHFINSVRQWVDVEFE